MGLISMEEIAERVRIWRQINQNKREKGLEGRQNKDLWDNIKRSNIQVTGVLQRNQRLGQKE